MNTIKELAEEVSKKDKKIAVISLTYGLKEILSKPVEVFRDLHLINLGDNKAPVHSVYDCELMFDLPPFIDFVRIVE